MFLQSTQDKNKTFNYCFRTKIVHLLHGIVGAQFQGVGCLKMNCGKAQTVLVRFVVDFRTTQKPAYNMHFCS